MKNKEILQVASVGALLFGGAVPAEETRRPNVVFFISDQHRGDLMGCAGNPVVKTPNMDQLAADGVRFDRLYSQWPLCGPSRACFMTGQYPQANGVHFNGEIVPIHNPRMARSFQQAGYKTGLTGIVDFEPRYGKYHGYDRYVYYRDVYPDYARSHGVDDPFGWQRNYDRAGALKVHGSGSLDHAAELHHDAWAADVACDLMEEWKDEPFFLRVGVRLPHPPYFAPPPYDTMYSPDEVPMADSIPRDGILYDGKKVTYRQLQEATASYYGVTTMVDDNLGKVMRKVDELGLRDNTIFIYCSDHGNKIGHHGEMGKMTFYDDDARIPFIMRYPGRLTAGRVFDELEEQIDVMPTLLEMCGIEIPRGVQGRSMVAALRGEEKGHEYVYGYERNRSQMICSKDWKYIHNVPTEASMLFNLKEDPAEMNNLFGTPEGAEAERKLKDELLQWHLELTDNTIHNDFTEHDESVPWIQKYMDPVVEGWPPSRK